MRSFTPIISLILNTDHFAAGQKNTCIYYHMVVSYKSKHYGIYRVGSDPLFFTKLLICASYHISILKI